MTRYAWFGIALILSPIVLSLAIGAAQPDDAVKQLERQQAELQKKIDLIRAKEKELADLRRPAPVTPIDLTPVVTRLDSLIALQTSANAKADAMTALLKSIDAKLTQGPTPTPTPSGKVVVDITFVGQRTATSADAGLLKWLADNKVAAYELMTPTPAFQAAVDKAGGLPCIVLRDKDKNIIDQCKNPHVEDVKGLVGYYLPKTPKLEK